VILVTAVAEMDGKLSGSKEAESKVKRLRSYAKERNCNVFPEFVYIRTPEKVPVPRSGSGCLPCQHIHMDI
jgi:hypothetical protein